MVMAMVPWTAGAWWAWAHPVTMTFYWGKDAIVLFSRWPNDSLGMYILALFVVLLMAFVTEVLPNYKTDKCPVAADFGQAVVHAIRKGLAYMVMLAAMSFNVGIFIAAVVGHAIGYYFFNARDGATVNQNGAVPRS